MSDATLTDVERSLAARHGFAVHCNRLIFEAMPPIGAEAIARIESHLCGPIPRELRDLWSVSFGGRLAYDLRVPFDGFHTSGSCEELFYLGSDHYRDLFGWIEHEVMVAEDVAKTRGRNWSGKIDVLPFAGFEYLERYYVVVDPNAEDCGAVLCWRNGVPIPDLPITNDCLTTVASSVSAFFAHLMLESENGPDEDDFGAAIDLLERLDEMAATDAACQAVADKLRAVYLSAGVNWRRAVADGSIATNWIARAAAMEAGLGNDDVALIDDLLSLGCDPNETVHGGFTPLRFAFLKSAFGCAERLLAAGADPAPAIRFMPDDAPDAVKAAMLRR